MTFFGFRVKLQLLEVKMGLIQKIREKILSKDAILRDIRNSYGASIFKYSEKYKQDRDLVKEALLQDGDLLQYFLEFRGDRELILIALQTSLDAFYYAAEELRNDKQFVIEAIKVDPRIINASSMPKEFKEDMSLIKLAIKTAPIVFERIPVKLKNDKEFILEIINECPEVFEYIPSLFNSLSDLKSDKDVVKSAVKANLKVLKYAADSLRSDEEFVRELMGIDTHVYKYSLLGSNEEFLSKCTF